jgi:hypothetical protein
MPSPDEAGRAQLLDQRPRELGPLPVAVDDRQHLLVHEPASPLQVVKLRGGELLAEHEVVGAEGFSEASFETHGGLLR